MSDNRDNFTAKIKRTLESRAGHLCSNPDCMLSTSGPSLDEEKAVNLGKAAHITAAAPGGPRYDASLTSEARKSISNGIWLCAICADKIDKDESRFPVEVLNTWKQDAVTRAFKAMATSNAARHVTVMQLDEADKEFLSNLRLPLEDDIESIVARMRKAAANDISAFQNAREWPLHLISLDITLLTNAQKISVTLDGVAKAVSAAEGVCFISPPGTGKTTTLIQLASSIINGGQIATFVPLGEWSDRQESFFEFFARRNAFNTFQPQHFMQVAYHGRLVLLLDGWNELNPDARKRALNDLKTLRREFTQLGIVIGTRRQAIPIPGAIIEIEPLSDEQQFELARKIRGKEGEAIVDQAWRTPGVHELVSIPLYLTAMLATIPGVTSPKTKEALLSNFVTQHESAPEKAEILRTELLGCHKQILIGLAVEANRAATATLSEENARRAISDVCVTLQADKQILMPLQPSIVLDVLVNTHSLVRGAVSVSFQHQQIQEWYASFEVERLMTDATQGNTVVRRILNTEVLNWSAWEESVLFACERLSNNIEGAKAVAMAVLDTLSIDPMLAAKMIYRSKPEVWSHISEKVVNFANRWHVLDKGDRAVQFMISTGRPEFAEFVWPLISCPDNQVCLRVLHAAQRFRPSVLGPDVVKQLATLPEEIRGDVVAEIGYRSGFDGMELAAAVAKNDKSPTVIVKILQSLQFGRADRHVADILRTASDEVWECIARKGYPERILDLVLNARLEAMRQTLITRETNVIKIIRYLTEGQLVEMNAAEHITQLIQSPDFPIKGNHERVAINNAFKVYPEAVTAGIIHRIARGLELPLRAHEWLKNTASQDEEPIADAALNKATPENIATAAYSIVGPITVGKMMDILFTFTDEHLVNGRQLSEPVRQEYHRLKNAIACSHQTSFFIALLERANTDKPHRIKMMADLVACHGREQEKKPFTVSTDVREQFVVVLKHWVQIMLTTPDANRHQFVDVAQAIGRLGQSQFVSDLHRLLEADFTGRDRELEEIKTTNRRSNSSAHIGYTLQYRRAFAAIGDDSVVFLMKEYLSDVRFGLDAACVLLEIWNRDHPSSKDKRFFGWHDFSNVKTRRLSLEDMRNALPTCEFSETIFEVVRTLCKPDSASALQQHALKLAKIGLSMPFGSKNQEITELFKLPQPYSVKLELFTTVAIAGEVLSADMLLAGFHELLELGKKEPWRLEDSQGEVMGWIELFAFSNRPLAVLELLDLLPNKYYYSYHFRRLLIALGHSPHAEALEVLKAMAERNPEMRQDRDWLDAMIRLETEAAARAMLDLICEDKVHGEHGGKESWWLSEQLANLTLKFPPLRDIIFQRYEKMANGEAKRILENTLIALADMPSVLALIHSLGIANQPYDGRLGGAIEKLATGQRPSLDWPGAFEQFSVPLVEFRKKLFTVSAAEGAQAVLAEACLNKIEELRDEHGRITNEPRHPDITSEQPWPRVSF